MVRDELEYIYRSKIKRKLLKKLKNLELKKKFYESMYITYTEYFLMVLSAIFLYALINSYSFPMLIVTLTINFFSALIYFYNRTLKKSIGITFLSSITMFFLILTFLYFLGNPQYINDIIQSLINSYYPIIESFRKLKEILYSILSNV